MNAQEKIALQDFLQEMNRVRLERKDLEADAMIRQAAQQQPDALYLLTQRALLQEQALNGAQQQIAELQKQIAELKAGSPVNPQGEGAGSFLDSSSQWGRSGHALGVDGGTSAWPSRTASPASMPQGQYQAPTAQPQAAQPAFPSARPGLFGGGGGSFLGSMAGVLAGAAAGNFLYQGMEHMLHRNDPQAGAQHLGDLGQGQAQRDSETANMSPDNPLARDAGVNDVAAPGRESAQWDDSASQDDWSDTAGNDVDDGFLDGGDDLA